MNVIVYVHKIHVSCLLFIKMKLQNLPAKFFELIVSYLPPKARIMLFVALENVRDPPESKSSPRFYCPLCAEEALFSTVVSIEPDQNEFWGVRHRLRYQVDKQTWEKSPDGSGECYLETTFGKRDFGRESASLTNLISYIGRV